MPFFSIITPTYKRKELLGRAVQSVLNQTFKDFEYLIVNNDEIPIENKWEDARVQIYNEKRRGSYYARNKGIELAKGKFICFLDDDDDYLPEHLEILFNLIKKNNEVPGLYRTFTRREDAQGRQIDQEVVLSKNDNSIDHITSNILVMHCVCLHKEILSKHRFEPNVPVAQDYHLWLRILSEYPLFESPFITTVYRYTKNSISSPSLEKYLQYIQVYSELFSNPRIKRKLSNKKIKNILFKYHQWILVDYYKELSFVKFLKVLSQALGLKKSYLFTLQFLKVNFKYFSHSIGISN